MAKTLFRRKAYYLFSILILSSACSTITINSTPPQSNLFLENPKGERVSVGQTPYESSLDELAEKANNAPVLLVVTKEGFLEDKILIPGFSFGNLNLTVELKNDTRAADAEKDKEKEPTPEEINQPYRLVLQAHKSLVEGEFETAMQTATEAEKLNPKIAAPLLIQGLVEIKRSNNSKARALFEKAKRLDPKDPGIDFLLELASGN